MVIYGEYLFLENFVTGILITWFTVKTGGGRVSRLRILLCGCLCGLFAFTLFVGPKGLFGLLGKTAFALLAARIAFGKKTVKGTCMGGLLFFAVTVLYGGITLALLTSFRWQGISSGGGVYMPPATYLTVTAAAAAGVLFVCLVGSMIKARRQAERTEVDVTLCMGERRLALKGFIDSGNFLKEPFTGKPVAVVTAGAIEKLLGPLPDRAVRYTPIPYSAVGTEKGLMDGYRMDAMVACGKTIKNPVLAICRDGDFLTGEDERGQILLPGSMLERGIYAEFD